MSFAIQSLQESIIGTGGYASEVCLSNRLKCDPEVIFEAIGELIHKGLVSKEFYENKGHKVLGRLVKGTNSFEINPEISNDTYDTSYLISFTQIVFHENKRYPVQALYQIFVGSYKAAMDHAREIQSMLVTNKDFQKVIYKIKRQK